MIAIISICICILCAIVIFLTWRTEFSKRKIKRLEKEMRITQVKLESLERTIENLSWDLNLAGGRNGKN